MQLLYETIQQLNESDNYGYHWGNLGKSRGDDYWGQGPTRGTGHFGYGTYFVGKEDSLKNSRTYGQRPLYKIDFSNYNLFKPSTDENGLKLHRALKIVNSFIKYYEGDDIELIFENKSERRKLKNKLLDLVDSITENSSKDEINKVVNIISNTLSEYYVNEIWNDADNTYHRIQAQSEDEYDVKQNIINIHNNTTLLNILDSNLNKTPEEWAEEVFEDDIETIKENKKKPKEYWFISCSEKYIEQYFDMINDVTKQIYDVILEIFVALDFQVSEKDIAKALLKTKTIVDKYNSNERGLDSASTIFMKALGYEGIDVRHLPSLDNEQYGSVIYDLKGSDLELSKANKNNNLV